MASSPMRSLRKTGAVDQDGNVVPIPRLPAVTGASKPPGWDGWSAAEKVEHLLGMSLDRMHDYLAARTTFFDRVVVSAIDRGVRQVVVGAAGYDGRALRYAKPGVRWFEVDHPASQRDKLARLERLGIAVSGVRFAEADFTRDPVADRAEGCGAAQKPSRHAA